MIIPSHAVFVFWWQVIQSDKNAQTRAKSHCVKNIVLAHITLISRCRNVRSISIQIMLFDNQ